VQSLEKTFTLTPLFFWLCFHLKLFGDKYMFGDEWFYPTQPNTMGKQVMKILLVFYVYKHPSNGMFPKQVPTWNESPLIWAMYFKNVFFFSDYLI
jgi:hypothetical protein